MRRGFISTLTALLLVGLVLPFADGAVAKPSKKDQQRYASDIREAGDVRARLAKKSAKFANKAKFASRPAAASKPGAVKTWVGLDAVVGAFYTKNYRLRDKGKHIEVWTATGRRTAFGKTGRNLHFQPGDCRNGQRTKIKDEQIAYLIDEFDNNIYPVMSERFSVAPHRNGENAFLADLFGLPRSYYRGDRDDIVVLIDNVRDENWYDKDNTNGFSYIAGFFSSQMNFFFDRNVMNIDAFDWLHRTGANPPHDPAPGDNCNSAPARPFLYEGVFAHEYKHLLSSYTDPAETTWQNEGIADMAIEFTGYVDPRLGPTQRGFDSHINCFQGNNIIPTPENPNPRAGGPENSLTRWGDQDFDHEVEILCDYGAAFSYYLWIADKYGADAITRLHHDAANQGFDSIQALLDDDDPGTTVRQTVNNWLITMALDGVLDDGAPLTSAAAASPYQVDRLHSFINWDTDDAYDTPGAPSNGADFVRLRDGGGNYLSADEVNSIDFNGVSSLPPAPIEWTVDPNPPGQAGNPALHSPDDDNRDTVIVQEVDIPGGSPELTFNAAWDLEDTFDFGYAQITTDGGETYESLQCTDTVDDTAGDNVGPGYGHGFNGFHDPPVFAAQTCDLSAYAGMNDVGLAFRYFSDSSVNGLGFWVDDIAIDGTLVPGGDGSTLAPWQSAEEFNPIEVSDWRVWIVAYDNGHTEAHLTEVPLDGSFDGSLNNAQIEAAIGTTAQVVSALVTYHDDREIAQQYACYDLDVNGVQQPGGC